MYLLDPDDHLELMTGRPEEPDCVDEDDVGEGLARVVVVWVEGDDVPW